MASLVGEWSVTVYVSVALICLLRPVWCRMVSYCLCQCSIDLSFDGQSGAEWSVTVYVSVALICLLMASLVPSGQLLFMSV